jgi:aspartate-semialdehyde dehydrogenase
MKNKKISCGILGATGSVGQKFVELLQNHPWFEISFLGASERSANKKYSQACQWQMPSHLDEKVAGMTVHACQDSLKDSHKNIPLFFSALDASCAEELELEYANRGKLVVSNAKNFRMHPEVPLVVPEVNAEHLSLIKKQSQWKGAIVCNPNCCVVGLVLALKPLEAMFGLEKIQVTSMQAISGAGFNGLGANNIMDNVLPYIEGEEQKVETEPKKIFGLLKDKEVVFKSVDIEATCNRVPVTDGHTLCVAFSLSQKASKCEVIKALEKHYSSLNLPSSAKQVLHYFDSPYLPQPKLQRDLDDSMSVSIGRLEESKFFDYRFHVVSHNTVRGAAGGAILNAELLYNQGYFNSSKLLSEVLTSTC